MTLPTRSSILEYLHACPLCNDPRLAHYCRVPSRFHDGEFIRYERCRSCGVVLRNPRLPERERLHGFREAIVEPPLPDPDATLHKRYMLRVLRSYLGDVGAPRLLDFGCGAGCDEPGFDGQKFHVALGSEVFERLPDPRSTLLRLRDHLVAPGLLLIEVPNLNDFRERRRRGSTMDDSILFYFSARSLTALLRACRFEILEVHQGARPYRLLGQHSERLPIYVLRALEKVTSASRVRTGLGVVARLRETPPA